MENSSLVDLIVPGWLAKFSISALGTCQLRFWILRGSQTSCVGSASVEDGCIWGRRMKTKKPKTKKPNSPSVPHSSTTGTAEKRAKLWGEHKRPALVPAFQLPPAGQLLDDFRSWGGPVGQVGFLVPLGLTSVLPLVNNSGN